MSEMLETKRLYLREPEAAFAETAAEFYQRNRRFLEPYEPLQEEDFFRQEFQRQLLEEERERIAQRLAAPFYLFRKEEPETMIGKVSLSNMVWGSFCSCFLGYKMDERYCNCGYMTEAVRAVVEYGFDTLGLHRIEANVMPRNLRSLRVLEKCAFELEGVSRKYLKIHGVWEDHIHMVRRNLDME